MSEQTSVPCGAATRLSTSRDSMNRMELRRLAALLLITASLAGCIGGEDAPEALAAASDPSSQADGEEPSHNATGNETDQEASGNGTEDPSDPPEQEPEQPENQTARDLEPKEQTDALAAPFSMDGTGCRELIVLFTLSEETARTFVPAHYTLVGEDTGIAQGFAGLKVCNELELDGFPIGRASTSDVGISIESPDGTDGIHYYQTWWTTDHPVLSSRLDAQGWRTDLVHDDELVDQRVEGLAGLVNFTVPWSQGGYTAEGAIASPRAPGSLVATGWFDGPNGTLTVAKTLTSSVQGAGVGLLTAEQGSPMATLIEGTETQGPALYSHYRMTGQVGAAQS